MRISREPRAHSGLALSQALVLHPFEQSVQIVSTTPGLSHGRLLNRYWRVVIAPTGQTSIRFPDSNECTPALLMHRGEQPAIDAIKAADLCVAVEFAHGAPAQGAQDSAVAVQHER